MPTFLPASANARLSGRPTWPPPPSTTRSRSGPVTGGTVPADRPDPGVTCWYDSTPTRTLVDPDGRYSHHLPSLASTASHAARARAPAGPPARSTARAGRGPRSGSPRPRPVRRVRGGPRGAPPVQRLPMDAVGPRHAHVLGDGSGRELRGLESVPDRRVPLCAGVRPGHLLADEAAVAVVRGALDRGERGRIHLARGPLGLPDALPRRRGPRAVSGPGRHLHRGGDRRRLPVSRRVGVSVADAGRARHRTAVVPVPTGVAKPVDRGRRDGRRRRPVRCARSEPLARLVGAAPP